MSLPTCRRSKAVPSVMSRRVTATSRPKRKKRNPPKGGFFFGSSRITGVRALGFRPGMLWPLAPRPWLAFGFAGLGYAIALYTWASRGETLASTLAAQTVLRVREGKAAARPVYLFGLRPLHLCGTRLEGGHQGLSRRYG